MYKMMTAEEVIDKLWGKIGLNRKVDFTFDNVDEDPDCDPTGWYGVKLINIFDERYGVLAMGYYGGGCDEIYEIESLDWEAEADEEIKQACIKVFQSYINTWCEDSVFIGHCEKVCVEVEEDK